MMNANVRKKDEILQLISVLLQEERDKKDVVPVAFLPQSVPIFFRTVPCQQKFIS